MTLAHGLAESEAKSPLPEYNASPDTLDAHVRRTLTAALRRAWTPQEPSNQIYEKAAHILLETIHQLNFIPPDLYAGDPPFTATGHHWSHRWPLQAPRPPHDPPSVPNSLGTAFWRATAHAVGNTDSLLLWAQTELLARSLFNEATGHPGAYVPGTHGPDYPMRQARQHLGETIALARPHLDATAPAFEHLDELLHPNRHNP